MPIPIRKEQSGYIINSLLVPWCTAALDLLVRDVTDFQSYPDPAFVQPGFLATSGPSSTG